MLCGQTFVPLIDERLTSFNIYLWFWMPPIHMLMGHHLLKIHTIHICTLYIHISYVCQYFTVTSIRNWFWNSFLTASLCSFLGNMQTVFGGYVNKNSWYAHYKALNSTRHNSEIFCRGVRDAHMNPRWGRYSWARYRYENLHTDTYIEIFHTKFLLNTECESTSTL